MITKIATGIKKPAGVSRIVAAVGRIAYACQSTSASTCFAAETYGDDLVLIYRHSHR